MRAILTTGLLLIASASLAGEKTTPLDERATAAGNDATQQLAIGNLYVEAMDIRKARQAYKKAKWKDATSPEATFGMLKIQMAEKNLRPVKGACRKLERAHPKNGVGAVCSGWYWLSMERPSRAVEEFNKAVALGDIARGKTGLGEAARLQADWDGAVAAFEEALAAGAGHSAHLGMGRALDGKGDKAGALAAFKKAVEAEPASCLARYHYGRLLESGPDAEEQLKIALSIRPDWFDALMDLGNIYDLAGNFEKSVEVYQNATAVDPKRGEGYLGLGRALYKVQKPDEALTALTKLSQLIPTNVDAYLLIADIQFSKGNDDAAVEALDKARGVAPSDVNVLIRAAEIYSHAKRFTNARAYLNQALSIMPAMSKAHAMLGDISCGRKLYSEGQKHYSAALKGDLKDVSKSEIEKKKAACKK